MSQLAQARRGARNEGFPTYPSYREAEAQWTETVPENWELRKLKFAAEFTPERASEASADLPYVSLEHVESETGKLLKFDEETTPDSTVHRFRSGDVLFGKLRPYLAKVWKARQDGDCTSELVVLRPREEVSPSFLHYQLLAPPFIDAVDAQTYGAKMPRVSPQQLGDMYVAIPSKEEQQSIAQFLNVQTSQIDRLIDKKERLIELLEERRTGLITKAVTKGLNPDAPMKDSGVEWLEAIPAHWDVSKLKMTAEIQTGLTIGQNYRGPTEERPYLRVANVQDGYLDLSEITTVEVPHSEIKKTELQSGDVLMTEGGDFDKLGRGYVWEGQIEGCLHQNHIFSIRPSQDYLNPRFLSYVTTSRYGRTYFSATAKQSTNLASTNRTKVANFPLPLPPREEQTQIVTALEQRESVTEQLKDLIQQAVSYLQEYRSALITAAVTGKIDVRDQAA